MPGQGRWRPCGSSPAPAGARWWPLSWRPVRTRYGTTPWSRFHPRGEPVRHCVTHLGRQAGWATTGTGHGRPVRRPRGRFALLAAEEPEPFEPSRVPALLEADVLAVPAAVNWPWAVPFAGSAGPLGADLQAQDPWFAHPARLRVGDSHVWIAFADAGPAGQGPGTPGGIFAPDHVRVPRAEVLAHAPGWAVLTLPRPTRAPDEPDEPDELGEVCEVCEVDMRGQASTDAAPDGSLGKCPALAKRLTRRERRPGGDVRIQMVDRGVPGQPGAQVELAEHVADHPPDPPGWQWTASTLGRPPALLHHELRRSQVVSHQPLELARLSTGEPGQDPAADVKDLAGTSGSGQSSPSTP